MTGYPDQIDPDLHAKLEALVHKRPELQEKVDELLAKRAAGDASKRVEIDTLLEQLVTPNHRRLWLGGVLVFTLVVIPASILWMERRHAATVASGTPTVAKVLRTERGSCLAVPKRSVCLRLELELYPPDAPPYTGSLTEPIGVEWSSRVQPGSWLTVSVNPKDRSDILFDARTMAVPPPGAAG
jgi:hypothetical protein